MTSIGSDAFEGCTGLTSIIIPEGVTSIGYWAFHNCSNLTSVTIGKSVTVLNIYAFEGCRNLTSVTYHCETIKDSFRDFSDIITNVIIGEEVTTIGSSAFKNFSGLTSLTIPHSVTSIGNSAFKGCSNLGSVYCYANPRSLDWESNSSDFKSDKATLFHVYDKSAWEEVFPNANVTFVGDLKREVTTKTIIREGEPEYWSSFYDSSENLVANEGARVYMLNVVNGQLRLIEVKDRIINKGQGVVLKSATEEVSLSYSAVESSADYSQNSLLGSDVEITNPGNAYVLNSKTSGLGFYKLSAEGKIRANKAYLVYGSADARDFMAFDDDEVTGIKSMSDAKGVNEVYNLSGQRVSRPSKGVYVVDGKKVIMK